MNEVLYNQCGNKMEDVGIINHTLGSKDGSMTINYTYLYQCPEDKTVDIY